MRVWPTRRLLLPLLLIGVFTCCNELKGQTATSGALAGVVIDQVGAVVPDANIRLKDNSNGTAHSTLTDREGVYQFFFLAPGLYTLTVSHPGFREEERAVDVLLGPAVSVNVTLTIAETHSKIIVVQILH